MNALRLPLLVLVAPFFLSACGSNANDPVQTRQQSEQRSSVPIPATGEIVGAAFKGPRDSFNIARTASGLNVTDRRSGALLNLPAHTRLHFDDTSVVLDLDSVVGKAYRLYRAAFGRAPDVAGLSYWIASMDRGAGLEAVAAGFSKSAEFKVLYGDNPTNAEMVARLYLNVLGREGDAAGVAYWNNILDKKLATHALVLASFSESAENKAALAATTQLGIAFRDSGTTYAPPPTAQGIVYRTQASSADGAEARLHLNERGAIGYAWVGKIVSGNPEWSFDLYAMGKPGARYTYELAATATSSVAERLATFEQWGAKGYLYRSTSIFGYQTLSPYDVFIKSSDLNTTYSYRLEAEPLMASTLNKHGAQGYAYRNYLYIGGKGYALYAKDFKSDATFDYVLAEHKEIDGGKIAQLNAMGASSYAYLGAVPAGEKLAALFVRSSASSQTYIYTATPTVNRSVQAATDELTQRALQGETYQGTVSGVDGLSSIFYKGGWIALPYSGVTFP